MFDMRYIGFLSIIVAAAGLIATVKADPAVVLLKGQLSQQDEYKNFFPHNNRGNCPEDFSPCICDLTSNGLSVLCFDVRVNDILDVFYRTRNIGIYSVTLSASDPGAINLPADLLCDKQVENIYLNCPANVSSKVLLTIDPFAFEYSRLNTTRFEINNCDLTGQPDMKFLSNFIALNTLKISNSSNVEAFEGLPVSNLPALKEITILNSTGLENIIFPNLTPVKIQRLYLDGNNLGDAVVDRILNSIASSSSASSLWQVSLASNQLTRIPSSIEPFSFNYFDMSYNSISLLTNSILASLRYVKFLGLKNVGLSTIEDGAFSGDYGQAKVNLEENGLTEFREDVFKRMLEQMAVQPPGIGSQVIITGNSFDCGCGLAWLIHDNPNLLPLVKNGVCGGFFRFEDLNPDSYTNCKRQ